MNICTVCWLAGRLSICPITEVPVPAFSRIVTFLARIAPFSCLLQREEEKEEEESSDDTTGGVSESQHGG